MEPVSDPVEGSWSDRAVVPSPGCSRELGGCRRLREATASWASLASSSTSFLSSPGSLGDPGHAVCVRRDGGIMILEECGCVVPRCMC